MPASVTFFLPRPANHHKPPDSDGSSSDSLDTECPDVWSPDSRYGHLAGMLVQAGPSLLGCDGLPCGSRVNVADFRAFIPTEQW